MEFIYQQQILDHYKNPRNFGEIVGADKTHCEDNVTCGDKICIYKKDNQYSFTGTGCAISMAAASMLLEKINNEKIPDDKIPQLTAEDITSLLKITLSPNRLKCALLIFEALKNMPK